MLSPRDDIPLPTHGLGRWSPADIAANQAEREAYLEMVMQAPQIRRIAERALAELALQPGHRVLDAGCGPGVFLPFLADAVGPTGHVAGIDLSPDFVTSARQQVVSLSLQGVVTVEQGEICHLPFPEGSFDAARCERVLMHLEDPAAAVAELRRVTKPGGVVEAVETDWAATRVDCPDPEAMELLIKHGVAKFRQPGMGLELVRHFAAAGLIEIRATPMMIDARDAGTAVAFGLDLAAVANELVSNGDIDRQRADDTLAYLNAASERGTFFAYGSMIVATGRVPA